MSELLRMAKSPKGRAFLLGELELMEELSKHVRVALGESDIRPEQADANRTVKRARRPAPVIQEPPQGETDQKNDPRPFDGTLGGLIACYKTDPDSPFQQIQFNTRENYLSLLRRIEPHGAEKISDINARTLRRWHESWVGREKRVAMAHSLMTMLRGMATFGATILESTLKVTLHDLNFEMPKARAKRLTMEHANLIRAKAHEMRLHSVAIAQAFQFECKLKQKDTIGEWVPVSESGVSDVIDGNEKWIRGLRWEEIDEKLILRRGKQPEVDLKLYPMVREELEQMGRKASGPVIVYERSRLPYQTYQFRREWRKVADAAGIPKDVMNMDSRAPARLDRLAPSHRPERGTESAR